MTIYINSYSLISALGNGIDQTRENLFQGKSPGMIQTERYSPGRRIFLGMVNDPLPELEVVALKHRSRNNQLLLAAFKNLEESFFNKFGGVDKSRIAIIIGSSTSGISDEENIFSDVLKTGSFPASFDLSQRLFSSPANFLADYLGVTGPAHGISTACTSSAKAVISGEIGRAHV